ncbi:MAG: urease accessory protein UreE, partial [Mesorhizobium sp.]
IEAERILILRDHVIKAMLEGLGATVREVSEPFKPVRGAYSGHGGHDHGHAHSHAEAHAHAQGEHTHSHAHSHSHSYDDDDHHHHD